MLQALETTDILEGFLCKYVINYDTVINVSSGEWEALSSGQDPVGGDGGAAPSQSSGSLSDWPGQVQQETC